MKLQEINLYACEEYKIEREAQRSNRAMRMCPRSGQIFSYTFLDTYSKDRKAFSI